MLQIRFYILSPALPEEKVADTSKTAGCVFLLFWKKQKVKKYWSFAGKFLNGRTVGEKGKILENPRKNGSVYIYI